MLATICAATLLTSAPAVTPASDAIIEAVDAAAKMASQSLEAQFLPGGLSYSAPALFGGRITGGRKLSWPVQCTNLKGYPYSIYIASQKRALSFSAVLKNSKGAVVARSSRIFPSQVLSFTPVNQEKYSLEVEMDESDSIRSAQVAAVIVEINGKKNIKPAQISSLVRKLVASTQENLDMGQDYVAGKNIMGIMLSPLQLSWTYSGHLDVFTANSTANIVSNGASITGTLKDSGGPNPIKWGDAEDLGGGKAVLFADTMSELRNVTVFLHNKSRADTLYMVGITKSY